MDIEYSDEGFSGYTDHYEDEDDTQSTPDAFRFSTFDIYGGINNDEEGHELVINQEPSAQTSGKGELADACGWLGATLTLWALVTTLVLMGHFTYLPVPDRLYGIYISLFLAIYTISTVLAGVCNQYLGVNVAYTRKIVHFFSFFLPFGLYVLIPFEKSLTTYVLTFCCAFLAFVPLTEPIRNAPGMWFIRMAFASFDRPEDRPYTLVWAVTQNLAVYMVMIPVVLILYRTHAAELVIIPLSITGIGDGMAEVIGRPYGRHKYKTTALFTNKVYTRSVEGSMAIVVTSIMVVTILYATSNLRIVQYLTSLVIIPIPMAITEAISMHSWDNAFLCFVGGCLSIVISLIPL